MVFAYAAMIAVLAVFAVVAVTVVAVVELVARMIAVAHVGSVVVYEWPFATTRPFSAF